MVAGSPNQSRGTNAAYGKRKPREIRARRTAYMALNALGLRPPGQSPDFVEFAPAVRDARQFSDLSARVTCYLGDLGLPLYLPGPRFPLDPALVPSLEAALVRDPGWVDTRPSGKPYLLVHRLTATTLGQMLRNKYTGARVVDTSIYYLNELAYWRVREKLAWPNYPSAEASLQRLREHAKGAASSYILATGPSALGVDLAQVQADVRITCNSAVRDEQRLLAFRPTIIAFTDPVFHFGPSRYAAAFRRDLLRAVELCDPLLLCGSHWVSPLLTLLPELADRLAVIPFGSGGQWRWPTDANPTVRTTGSVLTNLMLPVALMLTDRVAVAGVDGRQPSENYFWKHGLQYSDELMRTVFDAHPAFFRDCNYEDHYDLYCREIEEFLQVAEGAGKVIEAAAPSWILAFRKRGAAEPSPTS
ncbi:MAG: hypothetical protein WA484_00165 [Solirubrobacteraceae bacterium]